jgi:glycosyltransferase involved in cell wall biosynthesis
MLQPLDASAPSSEQISLIRSVASDIPSADQKRLTVAQLSHFDMQGARFNGHDLMQRLQQRGYLSNHLVWAKEGSDATTHQISNRRFVRWANRFFARAEQAFSLQSLLYPWAFGLPLHSLFRRADVVHMHLIHTGYFSLAALPLLSRLKPIVWTLHDPWALTGHCIHPYGCERWQGECGSCPNLAAAFAMRRDHTRFMHRTKRRLYAASDLDIVVASQWMLDSVRKSPLLGKARAHLIPFGIDLNTFSPGNKAHDKAALSIDDDALVVAFRSTSSEFKGLEYIIEALNKIETKKKIAILTFNEKGHIKSQIGRRQIVELGWINEPAELAKALRAADVFLMPSMAESFGMMALEAIACGVPTIVTRGSPMEDFVIDGVNGLSVPRRDPIALARAIDRLLDDDLLRENFSREARRISVESYDIEHYIDRHIQLYEEVVARRRSKVPSERPA